VLALLAAAVDRRVFLAAARRGTGNRLRIPWTEQIESECRCRIAESAQHPNSRPQEAQYEPSAPTVADRVARTVARVYLEPKVEPAAAVLAQ
jgi:hypothetical protein